MNSNGGRGDLAPDPRLSTLEQIAGRLHALRTVISAKHALLAGVSGIDGSGKSTLAPRLAALLEGAGLRTARITIDAWHHPPAVRFSEVSPGEHFFENAFRYDEFYDSLILPLKRRRSVQLQVNLTRQPQNDVVPARFDLRDVDVVVVEGIFLFRREHRDHFDARIWVDCTFTTALERALRRNQEGQTEAELIRDYDNIYFAAQRVHFRRDDPRGAAHFLIDNEPQRETQPRDLAGASV